MSGMGNEMAGFSVGAVAPGVFKDLVGSGDGATLFQDETGIVLALHIKSPTPNEVYSCRKHTIETAYYAEGAYWLGQIRFAENKKFCFDFSFTLTSYPRDQREMRARDIMHNNGCLVVLIDRANAVVRALRMVTIPPEFHESLYRACLEQLKVTDDINFADKLYQWRFGLYNRYDYNELWRASKRSGVFGTAPNGWQEKYSR